MTNTIHTRNYSIHLLSELKSLEQLIPDRKYSQIFVLVDENTEQYCLPKLLDAWGGKAPKTIRIPSGENHKTLQSCSLIWEQLLKEGADRHSLLLNLGGGVIGDIGGFCASTYMRGMDFIQVPTTLLAQVDASIGGKLGIDFGEVKNSIGLFHEPLAIWVFRISCKPCLKENGEVALPKSSNMPSLPMQTIGTSLRKPRMLGTS
jgi:3-dehydroquinate synthase